MKREFAWRSTAGLVNAVALLLVLSGCQKPPAANQQTGTGVETDKARPAKPVEQAEPAGSEQAGEHPATGPESGTPATAPADDLKVIAYYFHGTLRCPTCLAIEKQAREALELAYAEELRTGRLEWHAINIEEPGNEHFASDFDLSGSTLVYVQMRGGEVVEWKHLEKVWELVQDPLAFQEYVWGELLDYLPD